METWVCRIWRKLVDKLKRETEKDTARNNDTDKNTTWAIPPGNATGIP